MGDREHGFRRRTVLAGTSTLAFWGPFASADRAGQRAGQGDGFVVEQGDECVPITPLSGADPVDAFYDWNLEATDYSSAGTTDLQRPDTSILFLYRGPDDTLSLVVVHDQYEPDASSSQSGGGSVTFRIAGLPEDGRWVVRDDFYDAPSRYDVWQVDGEPQQIDWTWAGGRNDGGAFAPLNEPFDVTIDPGFNGEAALAGQHYEGQITDWQVLSGDRSAPARTSLALDQPVRLRTGTCEPDAAGTDGGDGPVQVAVDVVPGRVNPGSRGRLPVDLRSTDAVSVEDVDLESIRTVPAGARPVAIRRQPGREDTVRLFFRVPDLDLSGDGTATLEIEGETTDGRDVTGEDTVRLTPNRDGDDGQEDDDDADDDDDEGESEQGNGRGDRDDDDDGRGRGNEGRGQGNNGRGRGPGDDDDGDDDDEEDDDDDDDEGSGSADDDGEEDEEDDDDDDDEDDDEEEDDDEGDDEEEEDDNDDDDDDG